MGKRYDKSFKLQAARFVADHGYSFNEAGERLGVRSWSVRSWLDEFRASGGLPPKDVTAPAADERKAPRKANRRLRLENDILIIRRQLNPQFRSAFHLHRADCSQTKALPLPQHCAIINLKRRRPPFCSFVFTHNRVEKPPLPRQIPTLGDEPTSSSVAQLPGCFFCVGSWRSGDLLRHEVGDLGNARAAIGLASEVFVEVGAKCAVTKSRRWEPFGLRRVPCT